MNADEHATRHSLQQLHGLCDRFEKAWQDGSGPEVSQFLESVGDLWKTWQPETRQQLLEELIKLDLEYRWQRQDQEQRTADMAEQDTLVGDQGVSNQLFLEDYVRQHPELGSSGRLSLQLVVEEYRVRQRWGDQPGHQEYLKRFPDHGPQLQEQLAQVDSDLSSEQQTHHRQLTSSNTVPSPAMASGRFGDYELLEEIARGGMGVVYKARQISLNRVVALKMILSGQLASDEDVRRFRSEAEAAANLQHPNIVGIYEVGTIDGQHYFSMDFIEGHSLADQAVLGTMEVEAAAKLVSQVATAIEYAHQQGILHRDLKPHNVLMDGKDQPWVTDFGLAKRIEGQSDLTGTGQVLGTPSYMPPEQASADTAAMGPASDVYSLGAILYELVTGRPPFKAQTPLDTLLQVLGEEPVAPHSLNGSVPADLETIILKCLDKDPRRRYQSAQELVDELGRYLAGEPIQARPIGQWERAWRWCRRKPALAGLYGTAAVLLLMLGIGGPMVAFQQASLRSKADQATEAARQNLETAETERQRADREAAAAKVSAEDALAQKEKAEAAKIVAQRNAYNSDMIMVQKNWEEGNYEAVGELLDQYRDRDDVKCFEWEYWNQHLQGDLLTVKGLKSPISPTFSCDGKWLAAGLLLEKKVKVWNVSDGRLLQTLEGHTGTISSVAFSPQDLRLASASADGTIKFWDMATGEATRTVKVGSSVASLSFSGDGRRLACVGADLVGAVSKCFLVVWDVASGENLLTIDGLAGFVSTVALSADGKWLAAEEGGEIKFWDALSGQRIKVLANHNSNSRLQEVLFSPDAKHLASLDSGGIARVWDLVSEKELFSVNSEFVGFLSHLSFSTDGKWLAVGCGDVKVWNVETGREVLGFKGYTAIDSVSFSPDGKHLAAVSAVTGTIKVLDLLRGQKPLILEGGRPLSFHSNNKWMASGASDGFVTIWDVTSGEKLMNRKGHQRYVTSRFSPDGNRLMSTSIENWENGSANVLVHLWNPFSQKQLKTVRSSNYTDAFFSPNSKRFTVARNDGQVMIWDIENDKEPQILDLPGVSRALSFNNDGSRLASARTPNPTRENVDPKTTVDIWEVVSGRQLLSLKGHARPVHAVVFSPDGEQLASASADNTAKVWDADSGEEILTLVGESPVVKIIYSLDSQQLAILREKSKEIKLLKLATGRIVVLRGHKSYIQSMAFNSDGTRMATGSLDDTVKVFSSSTGGELLSLGDRNVMHLAFSPDGKSLASVSNNKTIKIWGSRMRSQPASADAQPE